jgi:high-affinity iron transporter
MLGQYLITFREVLEAALITAIILAYLTRTGRENLTRYVWIGVFISVVVSLVLGAIIWTVYGALDKPSKVLFEGVAALIAVAVLTSMIFWMALKGRHIKEEMEQKLGVAVKRGAMIALITLAFIVVFREGLETVLFLTPFLVTDVAGTVAGAALGIISGFVLAFAIFKVGMKINLHRFFYFTLGIPSDSVFHHKGAIGAIFAVMFGYSVKMEWIRVIGHAVYLAVMLPLVVMIYKRPDLVERATKTVRKFFSALGRSKTSDGVDQ